MTRFVGVMGNRWIYGVFVGVVGVRWIIQTLAAKEKYRKIIF